MIYTQKRIRIRNSLDGGTDKMSLGTATTVVDKRNSNRSTGIMIFLMEAILASMFFGGRCTN